MPEQDTLLVAADFYSSPSQTTVGLYLRPVTWMQGLAANHTLLATYSDKAVAQAARLHCATT
jgi:hypothetical protein